MRLVVSHPEAYFFPWWRRGTALKGPLLAAGVGADEFKSFPSAHTANAATMLLLGWPPASSPGWDATGGRWWPSGSAGLPIVAFSRIMLGAH